MSTGNPVEMGLRLELGNGNGKEWEWTLMGMKMTRISIWEKIRRISAPLRNPTITDIKETLILKVALEII